MEDQIFGIGFNGYLNNVLDDGEWSKSVYVSGSFGIPMLLDPLSGGSGWSIGFGYEFAKHYRAEFNYIGNKTVDNVIDAGDTTTSRVLSISFQVMTF